LEIKIPDRLDKFRHDDIVKAIATLNPKLREADRTSWRESIPDLEEPLEHIAVEVELNGLQASWGQCLYYYRMGAKEIHLILSPKLKEEYDKKESKFVRENPIPNVIVYALPSALALEEKMLNIPKKKRGRPKKQVDRVLPFITPPKTFIVEPLKRTRNTIMGLSSTEKKIGEEKIYELEKGGVMSTRKCQMCNQKMKMFVYTNNFNRQLQVYVCKCGYMETPENLA